MRLHVVRLLYGTYWAPKRLTEAALMLPHATSTITARPYCGLTSERVALEAPVDERRSGHSMSAVRALAEAQAAQATELGAAAEARAKAAEAELARLRRLLALAADAPDASSIKGAERSDIVEPPPERTVPCR